jgi:hypothetical protein
MAQGPIDYTRGFGTVNPFGSVMQGLEAGATFAGIQQQQQARAMQMQAAQAEQERRVQLATDIDAALANPNSTRADFDRLALRAGEKPGNALIEAFKARTAEQQNNDLTFIGQARSALAAGKPEITMQLIEERVNAARNSGREGDARAWDTWATIIRNAPDAAAETLDRMLAILPNGGAVLENIGRVGSERRANELAGPQLRTAEANAVTAGVNAEFARPLAVAGLGTAQANAVTAAAAAAVAPELARLNVVQTRTNIRNLESQIGDRAVRQRLDADRLALDTARTLGEIQDRNGRIPESAQKDVNGAAVAAGAATQQANRLNALATELSGLNAWSGAAGSAAEFLKRATGSQNAQTLLRQEYVRMRQSLVSQALPPGAASDKDIALAMEGFLPSNADPQAMASFLRGMAKVQSITAEVETARGDWLTNNRGSLGRAAQPFQAGRFRTVPGETFAGFTDRVTRELARPPEGSAARAIEQIPDSGAPRAPASPRPAPGTAAPALPPGFAVDRR